MFFALLAPETTRTVLFVLIAGGYLAYHLVKLVRRWRRRREDEEENDGRAGAPRTLEENGYSSRRDAETQRQDAGRAGAPRTPEEDGYSSRGGTETRREDVGRAGAPRTPEENGYFSRGDAETQRQDVGRAGAPRTPEENGDPSGEELYARARGMPHQVIPDYNTDAEYLELLGHSAMKGYPRACAKMGDYAMRREAWVEAYYWLWQAKRGGMQNLNEMMREVRKCWTLDGFPNQTLGTHRFFSETLASIGRALLAVDTNHDAYGARKFLKEQYPQFLQTD